MNTEASEIIPTPVEHPAFKSAKKLLILRGNGGAPSVEPLPPDRSTAAGCVLAALLYPNNEPDLAAALARLRDDNQAMLTPDSDTRKDTILQALAEQMQILDAVFHRYTLEAMKPGMADTRAALQKVAFNAQAAYVRAAAVLVTAREARRTVNVVESVDG